ncbi:MAG: diguanylate cyclase [Proteobacteria bacterium]|nr:diguanylate cyclase [Pseudomonadota bacterium]
MKVDKLINHLRDLQIAGWDKDKALALRATLHPFLEINNMEYPAAKVLAQKLDKLLDPYLQTPTPPPPEAIENMIQVLTKLHEVISVHVVSEDMKGPEESTAARHTLVLGLKDKQLAKEIADQVKYFSYNCVLTQSLQEVLAKTQRGQDIGAVILDIAYCDLNETTELLALAQRMPLIFISESDNVAVRLFAVKAGGKAFFVCPIEFTTLLETIDQVLTPPSETLPFRILIVEDSKTQANIIRMHLEQAGMITEILMDPLKVMETLTEFQPDLILLDLYMPQCSGIELAKVIRQHDMYVGIPIVFLSAEDDTDKQLIAISGGGDDFLTKPILPHHLIAAVIARAVRSRTLRSEMSQDSLTGLLNHTRILEQLELEIARSKRNHTPLSFAMIDIDHFKAINDSHGHPVGDRVIKGLARLLKQRLRKVDSIGRYGGEEFAIVFPQTSAPAVLKKLDDIRRGFSKLLHRSSDPTIEFTATFSVGLAELGKNTETIDMLVNAADKALYLAKEQGRNRVEVYQQNQS